MALASKKSIHFAYLKKIYHQKNGTIASQTTREDFVYLPLLQKRLDQHNQPARRRKRLEIAVDHTSSKDTCLLIDTDINGEFACIA
jgi:hypothetical protein